MNSTPKYENPPVVETVIGVQFPELAGFRLAHFGLYWEVIKKEFCQFEDKPRLPEVVEAFPRRFQASGPDFRILESVEAQRVWYIGKDDTRVIQLQPNRFLFNWRERREQGYPSYELNSDKFLGEFNRFAEFCERGNLERPHPSLCEVTYINHIHPEEGETAIDLFGKVFTGLRWELTDDWLPAPDSASFNRVYVIGKQRGRLYAEASVGVKLPEKSEFVRLNLTGRVNCDRNKTDDLVDAMRLAHDWVVNGFASMTDAGIQRERWGRTT